MTRAPNLPNSAAGHPGFLDVGGVDVGVPGCYWNGPHR